MRRGDFAAAWKISDSVLERRIAAHPSCHDWPRHLQYVWRGQSLIGQRVLVRCYHGLGDTLQFVRLLAPLREQVREIILWAQPALLPLLATVQGVDRLLPLHDGPPGVAYDSDIELMELPHILRLTCDRIPARVPYIYVSGAGARTHDTHHDDLRVGLVWRGGDWDVERSISDSALAALARVPAVRWHSLQYPALVPPFDMIDMACADIREMAARMSTLDLVISVDTMAAHLAGALALPVWTLLRDRCDWRWMSDRDDSPWYPTMRLFRQQPGADWNEVIAAVADALRQAAAHKSNARYSFKRL